MAEGVIRNRAWEARGGISQRPPEGKRRGTGGERDGCEGTAGVGWLMPASATGKKKQEGGGGREEGNMPARG